MTLTSPGIRTTQEVRYGASGQTIACWPDYLGATLDPATGATVDIYRPGETTATISSGSCSEANSHLLTYALNASTTSTWPLNVGYKALFSWTVSTTTYQKLVTFDIVRVPLANYPPITVEDLKRASVGLEAAVTQLGISSSVADYFILPAWDEILLEVRSQGWRPALVTNPEAFAPLLQSLSLVKLYGALRRTGNDLWTRLGEDEAKHLEHIRTATYASLQYDSADELHGEVQRNRKQPELLIGPDLRGQYEGSLRWRRPT